MANHDKKTISVAAVIVLILVGAMGYVAWSVWQDTSPQQSAAGDSSTYTVDQAYTDINALLAREACDGRGGSVIEKDYLQTVNDDSAFEYQNGMSRINSDFTYAYLQYGCGSSGRTAIALRSDDAWQLVGETTQIYPLCSAVRGKDIPRSILDMCYANNRASEAESL